jgi:bacillithiol biosynthesis cysteine-adding enzyme BshC
MPLTLHDFHRPTLSGELPVKSQCLPFSQIPHSTRLFLDFLAGSSEAPRFYPRSARFDDWFQEAAAGLHYDSARRDQVAAILERQNEGWNASARTLENITRLRAGASAVVTGQQVGLFGGPLFAMFKALTAVKLADQASRQGVDGVPIFWLATEDHDLAEVNHTVIPASDGALQKLTTTSQGVPDSPVGGIVFGTEIEAAVEAARGLLGESEVTDFLGQAYRPGETFGGGFARLFAKLFAEWGVILLDATDGELHGIAKPLYKHAIERAGELDDALLARGKDLEGAGYHQQVKVTPSSTLLFALHDGARVPVHRRGNTSDEFVLGNRTISRADLLGQIESEPQNFSPNVLLRPVVQDYLLPTLAYTGGAAEVAYFAQAGVVYEALLGRRTPIVPRFSATIVQQRAATLLERYKLNFTDLFHGPETLRELLGRNALPQDLQMAFDGAESSLDRSLASIREALSGLDVTLVDSAKTAGEKMHYQLNQLRSRAARAELRQSEILNRHAEFLSNTLYPNKTLQEREISGIYFLARHGTNLLHELYETMHTDCLDHQVISL